MPLRGVAIRNDVQFVVGEEMCAGWLYVPRGAPGAVPAVVMAHGTTGTKDFAIPAYAERFVAAGYAVLTFDYRNFGNSDGHHRQLIDVGRQVEDLRAAIAFVRGRPEVDAQALILWGSSLGAGHVVTVAATDTSICGAIAQLPFLGVDVRNKSDRSTAITFRLFGQAIRDLVGAAVGRASRMVPMLGRPGEFAVFSGTEDFASMQELATDAPMWRNEVAARSLFSLLRYRPVKLAGKIRMPILFAIAVEDTAASMRLVERAVSRAVRSEVARYPGGHFAAYQGAVFEQMVSDETAFIGRVLSARGAIE